MLFDSTQVTSTSTTNNRQTFSEEKIQNWLKSYIANLFNIDSSQVNITVPFTRYGLDSSDNVEMLADLEDWLGCTLEAILVYDYPTIKSLAKHLNSELNAESHLTDK